MSNIDPTQVTSLEDLAACLRQLRVEAGPLSYNELNRRALGNEGFLPGNRGARIPLGRSAISKVFRGKMFPHRNFLLTLVDICGVDVEVDQRWEQAWYRLAPEYAPLLSGGSEAYLLDDKTNLLLRVYIPSERLYAAEADRFLSLFRDWFTTIRGHGVRQAGYRTTSGQMYEFFADVSKVKTDLHDEFNNFSNFLTLCSTDPSAAADMLYPMGIGRAASADFIARFSREVRQAPNRFGARARTSNFDNSTQS